MSAETRTSRAEVVVVLVACAYALALALATRRWDYDMWGALVVGPVLVAVSLPALRRVADRDGLSGLYPLLVTALCVKLLMAWPRWAMAFVLYDGSADAGRYDAAGKELAPLYRHLVFPMADLAGGEGTQMVGSITAGAYAVIGPTLLGGFVLFSWLSFWGLVAFYRAARLAVPRLDGKRYAALLFFLPSMIFWPSSIGKDAILTLALGLAAYGGARLFTRGPSGLWWAASGIGLAYLIRPHIAAMIATAIAVAFLVRRARRPTALTPVVTLAGAAIVAALGLVIVSQAMESLGIKDGESASEELTERADNTAQGGSQFESATVRGPADVPGAILTVFYRPFPWEATNLQMLLAAAEGSLLLLLTLLSYRRIAALARAWHTPYVLMAIAYLLVFIYAFSTFANFGIIARQRVQALPFLLLFLCAVPLPLRRLSGPAPDPGPDPVAVPDTLPQARSRPS